MQDRRCPQAGAAVSASGEGDQLAAVTEGSRHPLPDEARVDEGVFASYNQLGR